MDVGVKKLLRTGMVPARAWGAHAVEMVLAERSNMRRHKAAAAGKKTSTPLFFFLEAFGLEVEK